MIDMLSALLPKEAVRFRLTHNEYKSFENVSLNRFIRDRGLVKAFDARKSIRTSLDHGELWTVELGTNLFASYSFAGLLRRVGKDVPEMFDHVPPTLPRHDAGLIIEYSLGRELPWRMHWFSESRTDRQHCRAMTLSVLLSEGFSFDCRRATANAQDALDPRPYRPTSH